MKQIASPQQYPEATGSAECSPFPLPALPSCMSGCLIKAALQRGAAQSESCYYSSLCQPVLWPFSRGCSRLTPQSSRKGHRAHHNSPQTFRPGLCLFFLSVTLIAGPGSLWPRSAPCSVQKTGVLFCLLCAHQYLPSIFAVSLLPLLVKAVYLFGDHPVNNRPAS